MDSVLTLVFLPLTLGLVMFGVGLSLTATDFHRVLRYPRAAVIALGCQLLLMPAVCVGLVTAFGLRPELAVGMMLLAASPGGATASVYSHLFGGDVALNVTLTALNSVLAAFTLPVVVNLSVTHFIGAGSPIGLQFGKVVQVFAVVLIPVALGMTVRRRFPAFATRMHRRVRIGSIVVLVMLVAAAIIAERRNVTDYLAAVGAVVLLFGTLSLTAGYYLPRLLQIRHRQAVASSMEIGIHNSTLAITVAVSPALLDSTEMAIPAAVYSILTFFPAIAFGYLATRRAPERADDVLSLP